MNRNLTIALAFALPLGFSSAVYAAPSRPQLDRDAAQQIALEALDARFLAFEDGDTELEPRRTEQDTLKMWHSRVQQTYEGLPVFEGEAIVHLRRDGAIFEVTDRLVRGIDVDTTPSLSPAEAIALAELEDARPGRYTAPPRTDLLIFARNDAHHLAWRVQLTQDDGTEHTDAPVFLIDAHDGAPLLKYSNYHTASGTGVSLYSGTISGIDTYYKASTGKYYLETLNGRWGTFDMFNTTSTVYRLVDDNNYFDLSYHKAGVDAHLGVWEGLAYFQSKFGRAGVDGNWGPGYYTAMDGTTKLLSSRVHYGTNYNNAAWDLNNHYLTFGDGDGTTFGPLVSIDIAGHELTHGVVQYSANLTYSGESGALNESMADVFGTMIEFFTYGSAGNWQIGEDVYTPAIAGDALRFLNNPHAASGNATTGSDPDHYSERYTGTGDYGGVHTNSGIANKVFYLLAQGGSHHKGGSMSGIGREAAAWIWYVALTSYMTAGTDFKGARTATLNAAKAGYGVGSTAYNAVASAWSLCGVN